MNGPQLALDVVLGPLAGGVPALIASAPRPLLVRAQLADLLRGAQLPPPRPDELDAHCAGLTTEAWRRVALLVHVAEHGPIASALLEAAARGAELREWLVRAFYGLAVDCDRHTLELLARSEHRREELARAWLLRAGVQIEGETPQESLARLERLDYARVLNDLERARANARAHEGYLRELQEQADARLRPRGKM